jgi:hypothetical protein
MKYLAIICTLASTPALADGAWTPGSPCDGTPDCTTNLTWNVTGTMVPFDMRLPPGGCIIGPFTLSNKDIVSFSLKDGETYPTGCGVRK